MFDLTYQVRFSEERKLAAIDLELPLIDDRFYFLDICKVVINKCQEKCRFCFWFMIDIVFELCCNAKA